MGIFDGPSMQHANGGYPSRSLASRPASVDRAALRSAGTPPRHMRVVPRSFVWEVRLEWGRDWSELTNGHDIERAHQAYLRHDQFRVGGERQCVRFQHGRES